MNFDSVRGQLPHGIEGTVKDFRSEVSFLLFSDEASERSHAILETVRSQLQHVGWAVEASDPELSAIYMNSLGIDYVVAVTEDFEMTSVLHEGNIQEAKYPWQRVTSSPSRRPTGRLRLIIERTAPAPKLIQRWSDTTRWRIEDKLVSCVDSAIRDAKVAAQSEQDRLAAEERRGMAHVKARERAWLAERHDRNLTRLKAQAAAWAESEQIRAYAAHLHTSANEEGESTSDIRAWADWAMNAAALIDPMHDPKNLTVDTSFTKERSALKRFLPHDVSPYEGDPPS